MRDGAERTDVPYAWPSLLRPEGRARIAYLDLNHWIGLAKASVGHPDGRRHRDSLDALRELHRSGEVLLPLSATHYMEMTRIKSGRQRHDVASVMEELSGFDCLMDRTVVIRLELEAAFDELLGTRGRVFEAMPLIGNGALQALGMRGGLRVRDAAGVDVTERARLEWKEGPRAFDVWRLEAERKLNWSMLAGPTEQEEPELRREGWDPEKATAVSHERAKQEEEQSARLSGDDRWRRGRLRDVVGARYLALEIFEMLQEETARREADFAALLPSPEDARRFTDSMPSADVWITLLTARHRNPQTRWTANDIYDADALSVAVPYCDLVATEKHATSLLESEGLPGRVGTIVVTSLGDLVVELGG